MQRYSIKGNVTFFLLLGLMMAVAACTTNQQLSPSPTNESNCVDFLTGQPPAGSLYYAGQSDWKNDLNETRINAFQAAQAQLASAVESKVTNVCVERSSYSATTEKARQKMEQRCQTIVQTQDLDVGSLSKNISYCTENKSYVQAKRRKTVYRTTGRIVVSEKEFDQFLASKARAATTDDQVLLAFSKCPEQRLTIQEHKLLTGFEIRD